MLIPKLTIIWKSSKLFPNHILYGSMCTALHAFMHINQQQMGCNLILICNITSNTLKNSVPLLCPQLSAVSNFHIGSFAINRFCKSSAALSSSDLFHEVFVQINRRGINNTLIKALTTLTTLPDRTSRGEKMSHTHTVLEANVLTVWCYVVKGCLSFHFPNKTCFFGTTPFFTSK